MGRPQKEIDIKQFENLCGLQCTKEEICDWFKITDKTLDAWCRRTYDATFSEIYKQKRGTGKISLRRAQFRLAEKNATMAIWLGKQYLGQSDSITVKTAVTQETVDEVEALIHESLSGNKIPNDDTV